MKSLNFARYKFLKFIFLCCLFSLLIVVACGFAPAEASASTYNIYSSNFTDYTYSVPGEHVVLSYTDSDVFQVSNPSRGIDSYRFTKEITFDNTVSDVLGVPYYITVSYDFSDFNAQYFTLIPNGQEYTSSSGYDLTADRKFTADTSVRHTSNTYDIEVFTEPSSNLDSGIYSKSFYYVPYYNNSRYYSNSFVLDFVFYMNSSVSSGIRDFSGIDYSISIVPVYATDYLNGFEAGQTYANSIVNTESASYLAGINKGLDDAKEIVDVDSASYQAGFLAGTNLDYHAGYQAGIDYANSVVNKDSISYKQGYADGYRAGYSDGISDAKHGIWANATLGYSITYANSNGDREYTNVLIPIEPYLSDTVFYISRYVDWIYSLHNPYNDGYVKNLVIDINFASPFVYNEANYPFDVEGPTFGYYMYITTVNNNHFDASISGSGEVSFGSASGVVRRMYISKDDFSTFGFPSAIVAGNNTYYLGYESGRDAGLTEGYRNGYNVGYEDGYDEGVDSIADLTEYEAYQMGYDQALEDNPPGLGFDRVLTGIADTQINTITSLLNFEIFGVNLLGFFGGVLTLIIALFIFRKFI